MWVETSPGRGFNINAATRYEYNKSKDSDGNSTSKLILYFPMPTSPREIVTGPIADQLYDTFHRWSPEGVEVRELQCQ